MDPNAIQTPTSPLGNFPELAAMYRSSFQLPLSAAQTSSQAQADQTTVSNAKAAASAGNYQQIQKSDGGFAFFDSSGKEITAAEYAAATGKSPSDVLKNSSNQIDVQYQQDFNNLKTLGQAIATGDQTTIKKYYSKNPSLKGLTYDQLVNHFTQAYPTVYRQGGFTGPGTAGQRTGSTYIPTVSSSASPLDSLLQQYGINSGQ